MRRAAFLANRIVRAVVVLFVVAIVNFTLVRLAPGDPASILAGESGSGDPQIMDQLRHDLGLDRPVAAQFGIYVRNLAGGDLGMSYRQRRPVLDIIWERVPATLLLTVPAFALSLLVGLMLGMLCAVQVGSLTDKLIGVVALILFATPIYWLGLMGVLLFSVKLGLLPPFGMESLPSRVGALARTSDIAQHLVLPVLTLSAFYIAMYARLMRSSMLDVQFEDYIKTARAKGAGRTRILFGHALRNAVLPIVTVAGIQAGGLLGGAILIETVFAWPGLGRLTLEAVTTRDYNVLLGVFLVTSAIGLLFNIVTDLIYGVIDPRIVSAS